MKLRWQNFLLLTLAGIVNSVGVCMFIGPAGLYDSGISGTAMLLDRLTPSAFTLSLFLLVLNIPLFLYGLKKQGKEFTIYSFYTVVIYSFGSFIIKSFVDMPVGSPIVGTDLILAAVFGGMVSGMGSGLTIRFGGAIDGIEVMSVIFAKKLGITVGSFVMIYNSILYIIAGVITNSWIIPLYSIITYMAGLKTIDFIVEGFDKAKSAMIITSKPEEVCKALSDAFGTGMTLMNAKGYYSGSDKMMIYFIVNRFQIGKVRTIVHDLDSGAYISITEVTDVFGTSQ